MLLQYKLVRIFLVLWGFVVRVVALVWGHDCGIVASYEVLVCGLTF